MFVVRVVSALFVRYIVLLCCLLCVWLCCWRGCGFVVGGCVVCVLFACVCLLCLFLVVVVLLRVSFMCLVVCFQGLFGSGCLMMCLL